MKPEPLSWMHAAMVFVGSGAGGVLRYGLGSTVQRWWGPTFPVGTLVVNVVGCLGIGYIGTAWAATGPMPIRDDYRVAVTIGVLGGFTTFSTFSRETMELLHDGETLRAAAYIAASVLLGLAAAMLGHWVSHAIHGAASA